MQLAGQGAQPSGVRWSCALLACCTLACGGGVEVRHLVASDVTAPTTLAGLRARVEAEADASESASEPAAIAVGSDATGVWGLRLDAGADAERPWRHEARVTQPPVVDRELAVFGDESLLSALAAGTGEPLWRLDVGGAALLAAASSGSNSALLLLDPRRERRWISLVDASGAETARVDAERELGVPAAWRGAWLVPWGRSFVSALDEDGLELSRARLDGAVSEAKRQAADVLLGGPPWFALSTGAAFDLPRRPLPGRLALAPEIPRPGDTTSTRVYVLGESPGGDVTFMATFGRIAMGFEGAAGALLWVEVLPAPVLAGAGVERGFVLCDASGALRIVAARSGRAAIRARLARARRSGLSEPTLAACAISSGTLGAGAVASLADAAPSPDSNEDDATLVAQLVRASSLPDSDLGDAQRFLSRELAARPEPEATRALIDLAMRRSADRVLQAEAEDLLASRRNGVEFMLEALSAGLSRERDPTVLPPLGGLADALTALEEQRAAPLLAAQLNRPGHSADALWRAATALEQLATPNELQELSVFFSLRRATADTPSMVRAATAAGRTLLRIGGERGRQLVQTAARDALTVPALREALVTELEKAKNEGAP